MNVQGMTFAQLRANSELLRAQFGATGRELHVDRALTNVAIDHRPVGFIADLIFPVADVPNQSDHYKQFGRGDSFRVEDTRRSPGTAAKEVVRSVSSDTFYAENYALAYPITVEDRANADPIIVTKLFNGAAMFLTDKLSLDWENRVAALAFNTSNVGTSSAVSSAWTAIEGSADPVADVFSIIDNVHDLTGYRPNNLTFGETAWRYFRRHQKVRNFIIGTNRGGGTVTRQQVADLFEVERILVGGAFKAAAAEGLGDDSVTKIWGPNVLAYYAPANPSIEVPSFGYTFRWRKPGLPNMTAERIPLDRRLKTEWVEVGYYQDEKVVGSEFGAMLIAVDSST